MSERLYTYPEVAELLASSRQWVYDHEDEFDVVFTGSGSRERKRITASSVASWIEARKVRAREVA